MRKWMGPREEGTSKSNMRECPIRDGDFVYAKKQRCAEREALETLTTAHPVPDAEEAEAVKSAIQQLPEEKTEM